MIGRAVRWSDERVGTSPVLRFAFKYVFPDHWSFLLGEIALYCFIFLIASGTFMALFITPSGALTTYHGAYAPLQGLQGSESYVSTIQLLFDVPAGLLIRDAHHWAANVFLVAIILHLMRIFFTGAFRKPRDLNYYIGVTLLTLSIIEGYIGYSIPDDLLSGMGLAIGYGVVLSIPLLGAPIAFLLWDGQYPGGSDFFSRIYFAHVFIIPLVLTALISVHLLQIMRQHHSQFPGPGRKESNAVGTPMFPAYALRSVGLMLMVFAVLILMGGLIQINPIWEYGPYHTYASTNGAQPDWYIGWLIGALRIMPAFELHFLGHTWIPNPFWGGLLFPGIIFTLLYLWPAIERWRDKDRRIHHLLDRPRDNPTRTAWGVAVFVWAFTTFAAGASDRILVTAGIPYDGQVWFFRVGALLFPIFAWFLTRKICRELQHSGRHPLRAASGTVVRRMPNGGFEEVPVRNGADGGDGPAPVDGGVSSPAAPSSERLERR